ncbi:MAG: sulfotransferase family 2 domain-containing protein [Paracoccaceae bacterium]|nr:sulfotransferase family 2 domain-containing protein [Paracoccaceae bacterium]
MSIEFPKVVFIKNSKAACTSVAHAMYWLSTGNQYDGIIHKEREVLSQGPDHCDTLRARLAMPDYKTFTFVRHPIDRFESAFKDFVIEQRNPNRVYHATGLENFGCSQDKSESQNFDAFLDYVEASLEASRIRTDRHWRLQVDNIGLGRFRYDFIGKVERFNEDMCTFFTVANVDKKAIDPVVAILKNSSGTSNRIANKSQASRIQKLYAADFEAFDYD